MNAFIWYHNYLLQFQVTVKIEGNTEKPVDLEIEIQSRSQKIMNNLQIRLSWSPRSNMQDHSRANDSQDDSAEVEKINFIVPWTNNLKIQLKIFICSCKENPKTSVLLYLGYFYLKKPLKNQLFKLPLER